MQEIIYQNNGNISGQDYVHSALIRGAISKNAIIADNIEDTIEEHLTLGQRIADKVAQFGGSWVFITSFAIFLFLWMSVNVWFLTKLFDPYLIILLNLVLLIFAAIIQATITIMSQNRL